MVCAQTYRRTSDRINGEFSRLFGEGQHGTGRGNKGATDDPFGQMNELMYLVVEGRLLEWVKLESMRLDEWLTTVKTWMVVQKKRADAVKKEQNKSK